MGGGGGYCNPFQGLLVSGGSIPSTPPIITPYAPLPFNPLAFGLGEARRTSAVLQDAGVDFKWETRPKPETLNPKP